MGPNFFWSVLAAAWKLEWSWDSRGAQLTVLWGTNNGGFVGSSPFTDAFQLWCWRLWSPLDCKIKPVNPIGDQSWIFIGRTDAEAESPVLWPPDANSWLTVKDPDAGKDKRKMECQRMRWLDSITDTMNRNLSKLQDIVECQSPAPAARESAWRGEQCRQMMM